MQNLCALCAWNWHTLYTIPAHRDAQGNFLASAKLSKQHSQMLPCQDWGGQRRDVDFCGWITRMRWFQFTAIKKYKTLLWNSTSQGELFERCQIWRGPQGSGLRWTIGRWSRGLRSLGRKSDCSIDNWKKKNTNMEGSGQRRARKNTVGKQRDLLSTHLLGAIFGHWVVIMEYI